MRDLTWKFFSVVLFISLLGGLGCRDKDTPAAPKNLWQLIEADRELSILENAIQLAGLQPLFEEQGPYTVFAPTNQAFLDFFSKFGFSAGLSDLAPHDLQLIILYHVLDEKLNLASFAEETAYPTLFNGFEAFMQRSENVVSSNGVSRVVMGDYEATNGILHLVDQTFFIVAQDGGIGIPGMDGGQVGSGNQPNRKGP